MRVLWCCIFGHKFHIDSFVPDGGYERGVSGIIRYTGYTMRNDTTYCTRCGIERTKLVEETQTIAANHGKEYKEKCNNAKIGACFQWSNQCKEYDCYQ